MFDYIWNFLHEQFQNNAFFSGGAILGAFGALLAYGRDIPGKVWRWFLNRIFIEFEVHNRDDAFYIIEEWLAKQPYSLKRARWLTLRTKTQPETNKPIFLLSPAPGTHWLFWRRRFIILSRIRKEKPGEDAFFRIREAESFQVRVLGFNRQVVYDILDSAYTATKPPPEDPKITIYLPTDFNGWGNVNKRPLRSPDSVILEGDVLKNLIDRITKFRSKADWYAEMGIPHRLGIMLYGPPRNGKSSAAVAVASALNMDIAILSLSYSWLNDDTLMELLIDAPKNAIVLIEDIDCVFNERQATKDKENRITFSGLLNAIDGVMAGEGRIIFGTTNHLERLDPALIGAGRFDIRIKIDNATRQQVKRLFLRFFPGEEDLANNFIATIQDGQYNMATLQNHFIKYSESAHDAATRPITSD